MMRFSLLLALCLGIFSQSTYGQNDLKSTDDVGRIGLTAYLESQPDEPIPPSAKRMLTNKLKQVATKNGIAGGSLNPRFIITAQTNLLTKDITPTAPPMHAYTVETTFYIGDGVEGTLFASMSTESKGVGKSEDKAYISALKSIRPTTDEFAAFVEEGKTKIVEYYNSQCDFILNEAKAKADMQDWDGAITKVMSVPEVCKECHEKAMAYASEVFQMKIDRECKIAMNEAQAVWASSQDEEGATQTADILASVDPNSQCYKEATAFLDQIYAELKARIKELDQREWDLKLKQQQDAVDLQKQRLNAIKEIGVAYAKNQPKTVYNIRGWY